MSSITEALQQVVAVLTPFDGYQRARVIGAAIMLLQPDLLDQEAWETLIGCARKEEDGQ